MLTVTDPLTAGFAVALGCNGLQNILNVRPCLLVAPRHDRRAISRALFTTRNTSADEAEALLGKIPAASVGVGEMRVSAVDDNVARLCASLCDDGLNEVVDSLAGLEVVSQPRLNRLSQGAYLDEQHHPPWLLELGNKLFQAVCANNGLALGLVGEEAVDYENLVTDGV
jgi:hypothetical protein